MQLLKNKSTLIQFIKFGLAGVLNTAVDFAVLNAFIFLYGLGDNNSHYIFFKAVSFGVAVTSSYFINKYWVFKNKIRGEKDKSEVLKFIGVSLVGLLINISVSSIVFAYGSKFIDIKPQLLANIGALAGTIIVLCTNFIGYKLFVFTKSVPVTPIITNN